MRGLPGPCRWGSLAGHPVWWRLSVPLVGLVHVIALTWLRDGRVYAVPQPGDSWPDSTSSGRPRAILPSGSSIVQGFVYKNGLLIIRLIYDGV